MTIAQASKKCGLSIDTLRYYERAGLIPPVPRDKSGNRDYGEAQCRFIERIKSLRAAGMPVAALARYTALCQQGEETIGDRRLLLAGQRALILSRIQQLHRTLRQLDQAILQDEEQPSQPGREETHAV